MKCGGEKSGPWQKLSRKMSRKPITVLMPVYNGEKFLREAIESVLNQTYEDFEFLIINDASTDSSRDIIGSYDDPRIRLIDNEKNMGVTASLNKGLKLAQGTYIARMDADDISLPQRLEKQLACIAEHKNTGLVTSWYDIINDRGETVSTHRPDFEYEDIYYTLTFYNCLGHSTAFYDSKLVLKLGGYPSYKRAQDYALWFKLSRAARVEIIKEVLVKWRKQETNISQRFRAEQDNFAYKTSSKNITELLSRPAGEECLRALWNYEYLATMDMETIKKTLLTLFEVNQKLITGLPSSLNIDKQKIERAAFDKAWIYMAYLLQRKKIPDFLEILARYPRKKDFLFFMPRKLKNALRNIM